MTNVYIAVEDVKALKREIDAINALPFDQIIFTENGEAIEIDEEDRRRWEFIGLNNIDFVTGNHYKDGFK